MADVYVEVGAVKAVANKYLSAAQAGMKAAITAAAQKHNSGMTTTKPVGGKGIQVNVLVRKLAQDGNNVTCTVIGELFELPSKQRFNPGGNASGQGKVAGKIDAVAGDCVRAAVADLMDKIGPAIAGSQTAPASTGTAGSRSPLIYIAPFDVNAKSAPATIAARTKTAILSMMDKQIKANTKRFTQDSKAFKIGSGMPAYVISISVDTVVHNASTKETVATTKGTIAEHPSGNLKVPGAPGLAKISGATKPPKDEEKLELFVRAAQAATEGAIKWILQTHP